MVSQRQQTEVDDKEALKANLNSWLLRGSKCARLYKGNWIMRFSKFLTELELRAKRTMADVRGSLERNNANVAGMLNNMQPF